MGGQRSTRYEDGSADGANFRSDIPAENTLLAYEEGKTATRSLGQRGLGSDLKCDATSC